MKRLRTMMFSGRRPLDMATGHEIPMSTGLDRRIQWSESSAVFEKEAVIPVAVAIADRDH